MLLSTSTLLASLVAAPALLAAASSPSPVARAPNIVFIIVDDQDARQDSISTMQNVQRLLVDQGTQFSRFYAPISVCCPSRTSFLRAQAAHNTNITSVVAPWGGWEVFNEKGYNGHYLPSFLQDAGYSTYYTGKLMNGHTVRNFDRLEPEGWTETDWLLDPQTYNYWNASFSHNGEPVVYHPDEYSTDLVAERALGHIEKATANPDKPFFIGVAPIAPHSHIGIVDHTDQILFDMPQSAPRHQHLFKDVKLDYSRASHNPDHPSGASWVKKLEKLNVTNVEYIEEFYRQRLRSLQAVDELVESVVKKLEEKGVLDETIIIYTSDNGFEANAGHRRQPGKTLPYEEDINIPLVVRGPTVPKGLVDSTSVYSLADLGATILHLAGAVSDYDNDGALVPITKELRKTIDAEGVKQHHLAEYWVEGVGEGKYGQGLVLTNQTYRAVRVVEGDEINFSYAVWCTGEHEIYDLNADPDQMINLAETAVRSESLIKLQHRLDALLLVLKTCVGEVCRNPWKTVFPDGSVSSLNAGLEKRFDGYFADLPKVKYSYCDIGYHRRLEAPFWYDELAFNPKQKSSFVIQA
ncbi:putative arylsulfatase precursor [Leucosporidium creatinivorum]|uniref:Arylsulfatase n=1 Tax=Leucosporidium creatinivorum TaxID=106004 RepID=A0A1Y2FS00_9BASI|nr:putative arylsulfatase precursor [Leucosporidium creatinivorum]